MFFALTLMNPILFEALNGEDSLQWETAINLNFEPLQDNKRLCCLLIILPPCHKLMK